MRIGESLHFQSKGHKYIISFYSSIMKDQVCNPKDQHLRYIIKKWKNRAVLTLFLKLVKMLPW